MTADNDIEEIPADAPVSVTFAELGLDPKIIKALDDMGYEKPTPIQAEAIPPAIQGRDVLGIAQTGTGKTGAFTLPTIHKMSKGRARARMPRCLIICPTRELAAQVAENVEMYGKYLKLEMALIIGGVSFAEQEKKLMRGVDVLIATPGRLLDQFERGKILLNGVNTLVVDEADRMLDMGFIPDIEKIFKLTPFTRQVLFFSATMPNEIKRLVDQFLHQPVTIQVARQSTTADTVTQKIVRMPSSDAKQKRTALRWLIENNDVKNGIVFCNRKRDVDIVAKSLSVHGHAAAPIHGDLAQSLRMETLAKFKSGEVKLLVASDVAARGLDIPDVSHVFNYDVPNHSEDYVHRIGRTGRAGREGDTVMLVARLDEKNYQSILNLIKVDEIEELEIPGIDDFPKDGGRRKGNDRSKGRGRDRGRSGGRDRNRSGRGRNDGDKARSDNSRAETQEDEAPKSEKAPSRKAAPRRRAAPKRKPADDITETEHKTEAKTKKAPKTSSDKKSEKKPSRDESETRKKRPEKPKSDKPKREASKSDRSKSKSKGRRGRGDLKENNVAGFGDNMPAFFGSKLE